MQTKFNIKSSSLKDEKIINEIHIIKKKTQNAIKAKLNAFKYQDKQTHQFVIYVPSIEVSAYGETKQKAEEMIQFSLKEYCKFLASLSKLKITKELSKLGWKSYKVNSESLSGQDYSKSFVDMSGELKNFAVNSKVEKAELMA